MRSKKHKDERVRLPRWSIVCYALGGAGLLLLLIAVISERFANAYNRTVGAFVRALLAHMTSFLPFSLAEILIYCLPLLVVILALLAYRRYSDTWREVFVYLGSIVSVFAVIFAVFAFGFGVGYRTTELDERLSLSRVEVNADTLSETAERLTAQLESLCPEITFGEDGFSLMPYALSELNEKLLTAYDKLCDRYDFVTRLRSRIKPVIASRLMSYTHITGVYSFYTGEANLNVHFPDYTLPFTAAHELAHQRGIARENEANFIAFLVTDLSEDPYIRYSGYLNLLEYVLHALYTADTEAYFARMEALPWQILDELRAYSSFFDTFRDSAAADFSDAVNDTYLKVNGNEAGTASYGLVVELAVAFYHS